MAKILFVCTANQFRSPLAAATLAGQLSQAQLASGWQVNSAGTWAADGEPVPATIRKIARQLGLTGLDQHHACTVSRALLTQYDLILVMEANQREALHSEFPDLCALIFMLSEALDGARYDFPDPFETGDDLTHVATELSRRVSAGADKIFALADKLHESS